MHTANLFCLFIENRIFYLTVFTWSLPFLHPLKLQTPSREAYEKGGFLIDTHVNIAPNGADSNTIKQCAWWLPEVNGNNSAGKV